MSPSLLQLQTQASHASKPIAVAPALKSKNGSDDSISTLSSSSSSSSYSTPKTSIDIVRCSRCQRSLSIDSNMPSSGAGVIRFGVNSYYCSRCAKLVGFIK